MSIDQTNDAFAEASDTIADDTRGGSHSVVGSIKQYVNNVTSSMGLPRGPDSHTRLEDDHKLILPDVTLEYWFEREPRIIDGKRWYEYGLDATRDQAPFAGAILHHTSVTTAFEATIRYTQKRDEDPERQGTFGYHFLVGREGRAAQIAPLDKRTNHVSAKNNRIDQTSLVNRNTVSVSLHGGYRKESGDYVHVPPTAVQLRTAKVIMLALTEIYGFPVTNSWGHGEVQSNRMKEEGLALARWCRNQTQ